MPAAKPTSRLAPMPRRPRPASPAALYRRLYQRGAPRPSQSANVSRGSPNFAPPSMYSWTPPKPGIPRIRIAQQSIEAVIPAERVLLRLPSFIAAALVAAESDGIATIPTNLAELRQAPAKLETFRPPVTMPPIMVAQYWHERYHRETSHRWLRQTCFELFAPAA